MLLYGMFVANVIGLIGLMLLVLRDEKKRKMVRDAKKREQRMANMSNDLLRTRKSS
jgi:heme exporter protein D